MITEIEGRVLCNHKDETSQLAQTCCCVEPSKGKWQCHYPHDPPGWDVSPPHAGHFHQSSCRLPNNLAVLIHTPEWRKPLRGYEQPSDPEPGAGNQTARSGVQPAPTIPSLEI